jgi:diguanylate cyclase (GGDEF)-like protein/PAS domain S-box-containing protein/putative nucleotidyltransferase with HDIG domain
MHHVLAQFLGAIKSALALVGWAAVAMVARSRALGPSAAPEREREREKECDRRGQTEALHQASVERIRRLVDEVRMYGVFVLDLHGCILSWNAGARRIHGYDVCEITGRHLGVLYLPEDLASGKPESELRAASLEGRFEGKGWRLRRDGSRFWSSVLIVPLRDGDEAPGGYLTVVGDVSEPTVPEPEAKDWEARFHGLLSCTPAAVVIADQRGRIVTVNLETEMTFGYTRQELLALKFAELFPARDRALAPAPAPAPRRHASPRLRVHSEHDHDHDHDHEPEGLFGLRKDGTEFPAEINLNPIETEQGYVYITAIRDITERKRVEAGLAARGRQLAALVELVRQTMTACDPDALAGEVARLVARTLDVELCGVFQALPAGEGLRLQAGVGWDDGLVGKAIEPAGTGSLAGFVLLSEQAVRSADFAAESRFDAAPLARAHGAVGGLGFVIAGPDGPYGVLAAYSTRLRRYSDDEAFFLESVTSLMSSNLGRIAAEESLRAQASTDGLTGLHNVRSLRAALPTQFARSERTGSPLSVVMIDIDHFKAFNDTFGHLAGDEVLCQVGAILRSALRPYDLAARYGGEEFMLLLPDTGAAAALALAERVHRAIASQRWLLRPVTASLGVATARAGVPGSEALLAEADAALYAAKRAGRDRVVHHDTLRSPDLIPAAVALSCPFSIDPAVAATLSGSVGSSDLTAVVGALLRADRAEQELQRVRQGMGERLRQQTAALEQVCDATIEGWARALELRDYETEGHSRRVTELTVKVARRMGFDEPALVHVRRGALLHDIGKVGVPDAILGKPGPLDDAEWAVMRRHPELAYQMLAPIGFLQEALAIPFSHHERWDGTGYPRGLRGEQIPRAARIFAVADIYDALSHVRPYREAWPLERVKDHLRSLAGTHLEPDVIEEFLAVV